MKRVLPLMLFGTLAMVETPVFSAPFGAYYQVMQAVETRDEAALRYLVSIGMNINATNIQGKTALCTAVENQDYEGYELLLSQGATTRTPCMRNMNPAVLNRFTAEQPPLGTYYEGAVLTASRSGALMSGVKNVATTVSSLPYPHLGEILLGGVAVGAAFAVGVHGSGGGGDDPDPDPEPKDYVYTAPLNLKASSFEDKEYKGEDIIASANNVNFLNKINASAAYARGYNGYQVNRDAWGNLVALTDAPGATDEEKYITKTKVKVAVMDNGQYYNTDLYNAEQTPSSVKGLNYTYGVKSSANNSSYWDWGIVDGTLEAPILYKDKKAVTYVSMTKDEWLKYQRQFAPVCQGTITENCLAQNTAYGTGGKDVNGYYQVYYKVNASDAFSDDSTAYYIYPEMWELYKSTYGTTGYVYNSENAFGNYFETSSTKYSDSSHGTHVAGIVAGLRNGTGMQGVAYNAEVIPVKLDLAMGENLNHISDVVSAYPDLRIVNLSIGPAEYTSDYYTSNNATTNKENWNRLKLADFYQSAKDNNVALIFAAGNGDAAQNGLAQSSIFSVAPLVDSAFEHLLINVVALGNENKIATFSNRCGATAGYCLAAPGGDGAYEILSTGLSPTNANAYTTMKGTSQAAPVVSGSLAVLMGAFPFLKTQQAVQILLDTATYITPTDAEKAAYNTLAGDDNAYTVNTVEGKYNAIYGHGLVNLAKATDPVGLPKITFDTTATSANAVSITSSTAHVSSLVANTLTALPENLVVLDDYSRAYQMPTRRFVRADKRSDSFRRSFRSFMAQDEKQIAASDSFSFAFSEAPSDKTSMQTGSMSMLMRPQNNVQMRLGFTEDTASFGGSYVGRSLQNPFMNMRQAFGADASIRFAKNWALTGTWMTGKNGFVDEDIFDKMSSQPMMQLVESGMAYQGIKNVTLGISGGIMNEEDSLFGTRGAGAFKTDGAETRFVRVMANYQPTDKFRLSGAYTYGMTDANKSSSLMQFSRLTSDSFALTAEYLPDEKQTFGFRLMSPLRVRSGSVAFNLPVARDLYEDRIYRENYTASLKPEAREYDLSFFYANQVSSDLSWAGETGVRLNPEHQSQEPDYRALFKLNWNW